MTVVEAKTVKTGVAQAKVAKKLLVVTTNSNLMNKPFQKKKRNFSISLRQENLKKSLILQQVMKSSKTLNSSTLIYNKDKIKDITNSEKSNRMS